jgi:hypothetical protein
MLFAAVDLSNAIYTYLNSKTRVLNVLSIGLSQLSLETGCLPFD